MLKDEKLKKLLKSLYKGSNAKTSKTSNILSLHVLIASIERGDSARSNDTKSKFINAIFEFLVYFIDLVSRVQRCPCFEAFNSRTDVSNSPNFCCSN
jgi:hypothetical protein